MKTIKKINILFILLLTSLLLGCGGGGGSSSTSGGGSITPVTPDEDLPTEYEKASAFNKSPNEIYTYNSNSSNVAIDLPSGSTYFVAITNKTSSYQYISLVSSSTASIRTSVTDEPQQSILTKTIDSYRQQERDEAEFQFRKDFINSLKQCNNNSSKVRRSLRAGIAGVDHSFEQVGQSYTIYTSDGRNGNVPLNNCKLVAVTKHAKFFVDQEKRYNYDSHKDIMEKFVNESLTKVFDSDTVNIYDVMEANFGTFFDVDNDGKISVIITPYLSYLNSNYLGLFMNDCMLEDFIDPRDQILIAPPINGQDSNKNRNSAITNLCHEYQHLVNFSQRFYRNGAYSFSGDDIVKYEQELGFDEGCSVCSEALFRRARGERGYMTQYDHKTGNSNSIEYTGNDTRFNDCFISTTGTFGNVFPFYTGTSFNYLNYGRNGLFMLYLHDRFPENFKKLIQLPFSGNDLKTLIPQTLGTGENLDELQRDWHFAIQHEYLKTEQNKNGEDITNDARFKYNDWLMLNSHNRKINTEKTNLNSGYTVFYKIKPEIDKTGENIRFFIKSTNSIYKNLEINIIKL